MGDAIMEARFPVMSLLCGGCEPIGKRVMLRRRAGLPERLNPFPIQLGQSYSEAILTRDSELVLVVHHEI
ncbi:MAG: hypothetical protein CMP26_01670 [Roseibacillus sp.]|nr:hypothetical protein [Roseibacillus sp.]